MNRRGERGVSLMEALAALALIGLAVTTGLSILFDAPAHVARDERAAVRLALAERVMERTLATPFAAQATRSFAPGDPVLDRRRDVRGTVAVRVERPGLKRVEVTIRDAGGRTTLVALTAPYGSMR